MFGELDLAGEYVLGQMLIRKARMTPDIEAIILGDRRCTFQELNNRVNRLANGLKSLGIQQGDRTGRFLREWWARWSTEVLAS